MNIYLRKITFDDKEIIEDLKNEIEEYDSNFEGFNILKTLDNYNEFYNRVIANETPTNREYSPQYTYLAFNENNHLIGVAVLRPELKGELSNYGGNVGYLIRPSQRKKGYGNQILKASLKLLKEEYHINFVVLGCNVNNIASSKVIQNNGGIYSNDFFESRDKQTYQKYTRNL